MTLRYWSTGLHSIEVGAGTEGPRTPRAPLAVGRALLQGQLTCRLGALSAGSHRVTCKRHLQARLAWRLAQQHCLHASCAAQLQGVLALIETQSVQGAARKYGTSQTQLHVPHRRLVRLPCHLPQSCRPGVQQGPPVQADKQSYYQSPATGLLTTVTSMLLFLVRVPQAPAEHNLGAPCGAADTVICAQHGPAPTVPTLHCGRPGAMGTSCISSAITAGTVQPWHRRIQAEQQLQ